MTSRIFNHSVISAIHRNVMGGNENGIVNAEDLLILLEEWGRVSGVW